MSLGIGYNHCYIRIYNRTPQELIICFEKNLKISYEIGYAKCPGNPKISHKLTCLKSEGLFQEELESCLAPTPGFWHQCRGKMFPLSILLRNTNQTFLPFSPPSCYKDHRESTEAVWPKILPFHNVTQSLTEMQNLQPLSVQLNRNLQVNKIPWDWYARSHVGSNWPKKLLRHEVKNKTKLNQNKTQNIKTLQILFIKQLPPYHQ